MLEDRRGAVRALKSLAKEYQVRGSERESVRPPTDRIPPPLTFASVFSRVGGRGQPGYAAAG
jgi:hypothetical protein